MACEGESARTLIAGILLVLGWYGLAALAMLTGWWRRRAQRRGAGDVA